MLDCCKKQEDRQGEGAPEGAPLLASLVCLRFEGANEQAREVNEKMVGWTELLDALPEHLPRCMKKDDLLELVTQPPFATNETVAFQRSSA